MTTHATAVKLQERKTGAKVIPINAQVKEKKLLIEMAWLTAKSAFWNHEEFSSKEEEEFRRLIGEHFSVTDYRQKFKDILERICLAKRYISRKFGRYVPKPVDWLNIHFKYGFTGTARWLDEVNEQRKTVPQYNKGTATLAEGMLKFLDTGDQYVARKYYLRLVEQKQFDLAQIFSNTLFNYQYQI